jgi:uncharacterized protein DUF3105
MANKKRKRTTPATRGASPGGGSASTRVDTAAGRRRSPDTAPAVPVTPATPGGPNRQARKEEARRQREALRRKMARRRYYRIGGALLSVAVAAAAVTVYLVTRENPADAAGCGTVSTISPFKPVSQDRAHIGSPSANGEQVTTAPRLSAYSSTPPTSGPHSPQPLEAGVFASAPDVYRTIHSLEHAAVIIWYDPSALGNPELTKIQDFYRQPANQDHVIVAPYSYPDQGAAGRLPAGKTMVLVAWHRMQTCPQPSLAAAEDFVDHYRITTGQSAPLGYRGEAPEPGSPI